MFAVEFRGEVNHEEITAITLCSSEDGVIVACVRPFDTIPACEGQTVRRTDGRTDGIYHIARTANYNALASYADTLKK